MSKATVLYIVNNLYSNKVGGRHIVREVDESTHEFLFFIDRHRISYISDYIIKFKQGSKPVYLKNRSVEGEPYTEKELVWMLLKAKNYGSIKAN